MPVLPSIGTKLGTGWGQFLKTAELAGDDFADILRDQVRFRIVRSGATSVADVVPDSRAARRLWEDPSTREFMQGVLDLADEVSGAEGTELRGITLSTSNAGYLANRAVHSFREGVTPSRKAYEAGLDAARHHIRGTVAVRKGTWLHMGPERSRGLLHALNNPGTPREELAVRTRTSLGRGTKTMLHEINHVESDAPFPWFSEGKAETFARWPGRVPHAGDEFGIDVPIGVGRWADDIGPYQEEVASVRALLRMAGFDSRKAKDFEAAEKLLNGTPAHDLVDELADAIVARHATTKTERVKLHREITDLIEDEIAPDGEHADPTEVQRLARELERARRDRLDVRRA